MSYVSNAILTARYMDKATHSALRDRGWACVNEDAGGPKVWEADTYMRTWNHTLLGAIRSEAADALVGHAEGVVLVVHDESDEGDESVHVWIGCALRPLHPQEDQ